MTNRSANFGIKLRAFLARRNAHGDFLLAAVAGMAAAMVLSNNYDLAPRLFWMAFVPTALIWQCKAGIVFDWPRIQISTTFVFRFGLSLIIAATLVYLLSMNIATALQFPDRRTMDSHWLFIGEILFFITTLAHASWSIERFTERLVAAIATLVATSAAINVFSFVKAASDGDVLQSRLIAWLGVPGYQNATNISLIYAMFFLSAFAVIISSRNGRLMRLWLTPCAIILFLGVLFTQSRGAYLAIAVGTIAIFVLNSELSIWRRHWYKFAAFVLIVGVTLALTPRFRQTIENRGESYRPEIWKIFGARALDQPFVGTGGLAKFEIKLRDGNVIDQPHNLVLSAQVRGGIFCALAMVVALAASIVSAVRFQLRRRSGIPLAMITSVSITGLFDYNLLVTSATWPWLTFWITFAVCAGAEMALRDDAHPSVQAQPV